MVSCRADRAGRMNTTENDNITRPADNALVHDVHLENDGNDGAVSAAYYADSIAAVRWSAQDGDDLESLIS